MPPLFGKDPQARLDYDLDLTGWLRSDDRVSNATAEFSGDPGGASLDGVEWDDSLVKIWLKGGTAGTTVAVTLHYWTQRGRENDVTFTFRMRDQ